VEVRVPCVPCVPNQCTCGFSEIMKRAGSVPEACQACRRQEGHSASPPEKRPLCPANRLFLISKSFSRTVLRPDVQRLTRLRRAHPRHTRLRRTHPRLTRLRRSRNGAGKFIAGFPLAPGTLSTGSLNNLNTPADVSRCGRGIGREGAAPPPCQRPPQNARRKALRKSSAFR
jgi:hypothetical protein